MKKSFLLWMAFYFLALPLVNAQTLFTYGPYSVSKQEFLGAFKKNNTSPPSDKAYSDYLEMFIRYKLKVKAAYDMRLDTLPAQKAELLDFRKQVINNFLADEKTLQFLVKEAMVNSEKDIRISHIYIPFAGIDSTSAKNKANRALQELRDGKSFENVAMLYSSDPTVLANKGDIGWISTFVLPYPLEKLAYETPLNTNSRSYKSSHAYHIFRRTGERPGSGMLQAAQILIPLPENATVNETAIAVKLADSIYNALQNGANFGSLALKYSGDNASFNNQGVMQAFYPGTYDNSFEEPVFALQKDDDLSKPFRTKQGIHLVKRIGVFRYATDTSNADALAAMRTRIMSDPRHKIALDAVASKAAKQLGVKLSVLPANAIDAYTKSFFQGNTGGKTLMSQGTVLATINKKGVTLKDYSNYLSVNAGNISNAQPALSEAQVFAQFIKDQVMEEYQKNLEKYNPDFASQLKEFRDGNLVFEAMQANIWDKAVNDEAGLKRYYEQHRDKYTWKESAAAVLFNSVDSAVAQNFYNTLKGNPSSWKSLADKTNGLVQADSGRFEIDQLPAYGNIKLQAGSITPPVFRPDDLTTSFMYVLHILPANLPRNFEEAKGFVLNDYQSVLEEAWISALKKKYPVKINTVVLKTLNR
ncbi:peptidylprolyl isomerase [Flavihumibacter fluvii]|uniref:peptidylprolyl isomerase n=1 Tax=Flavihumibacter fluvii TaxID=2838157 RepID=UPI001BDDDBF1|nr:peptidylprolyl isomerase [Flavihumibacter fluvii]ULQ51432.1 peptidylprolyl isomerase [Flavihumibacter fluvii]